MFKEYSIPLILLAIFACGITSRILIGIFANLYDRSWNWYKKKLNANFFVFKVIWFIFSCLLLFSILQLLTFCIIPLVTQK